ncbi:Inositolphosphotransferase 1 [Spathaspora sp. JA1]|nr:Inositolphosphotransferase 1 [Spathaspora sp. JA1]
MSYLVVVRPFLFLYHLLTRIVWSGLNKRTIWHLVLDFAIGFGPVFLWLLIFKNAGIIPHSIRPPIHVKLPAIMDHYLFSNMVGGLFTIVCLLTFNYLLYVKYYRPKQSHTLNKYLPILNKRESIEIVQESRSSESSSTESDLEEQFELDLFTSPTATVVDPLPSFQSDENIPPLEFFHTLTQEEIANNETETNAKIIDHLKLTHSYHPRNCWYFAPPLLFLLSWGLLNIDYWFKDPITKHKDLLAWVLYVICHITVPIVTAVWLYVFHAPGALKLYGITLGIQNICGVLTHLVFPNAPPWFIHMYGANKEANYEMQGYAAGLIRVDIALGTHLHTEGFHASPIVFGAIPSLHSAMAVMTFFFVSYYARWTVVKVASFCFVAFQWWATIYLDHHWRVDLLIGLIYALFWFTIVKNVRFGLNRVDEEFIKSRLRFNFEKGSTMGMRVFRNTRLQKFFDPLE